MAAGTVAVNFIANTKPFSKGVKGARKDLGTFNKGLGKTVKSLLKFGIALATTGAVVAFAKSQVQAIDLLAKTSDKLGIATEDLGRWRFAAGLAGISTNTLDLALQRMVRRIGQAAQGTGEAQKTLQRFGLDAKRLVELDPSKQFALIGKHINAITNKGEQLATAMSLFDTEGVGLVNLFASNLGEAATEFERLGLAVSRADAAKIEQFADATSKLKQSLSASGRDFLIGITKPALNAVEGLKIIMENIGLTTESTAKAKADRAASKAAGAGGISLLSAFGFNRRLGIKLLGETLGFTVGGFKAKFPARGGPGGISDPGPELAERVARALELKQRLLSQARGLPQKQLEAIERNTARMVQAIISREPIQIVPTNQF